MIDNLLSQGLSTVSSALSTSYQTSSNLLDSAKATTISRVATGALFGTLEYAFNNVYLQSFLINVGFLREHPLNTSPLTQAQLEENAGLPYPSFPALMNTATEKIENWDEAHVFAVSVMPLAEELVYRSGFQYLLLTKVPAVALRYFAPNHQHQVYSTTAKAMRVFISAAYFAREHYLGHVFLKNDIYCDSLECRHQTTQTFLGGVGICALYESKFGFSGAVAWHYAYNFLAHALPNYIFDRRGNSIGLLE